MSLPNKHNTYITMTLYTLLFRLYLILNLLTVVSNRVNAQIQPDSTLGAESSAVNSNQTVKGVPSDVILGGAVRGTNLFHSFQNFNVNSGQSAYFTNPSGITNILTRVTGNNPSNIFGVLGVLGNANLFFINPHGIIFGPNASLALNGSFLATTANSINMSDGTVFNATKPQPVPLLTINVPIGLNFTGENFGSIQVQGVGHNLIHPPSLVAPITSYGPLLTGLETQAGHTLALVGGDVTFTGGIVTAPSGRIEVGSVSSGQVNITPNSLEGFSLGYQGVKGAQNILLAKQSLLNASGLAGGNIQVFGKNVNFTDSSLAFIENQGSNSLGAISVNVLDSLTINGITKFTRIYPNLITVPDGLISQALLDGKGADIHIFAKHFTIQDSAQITLSNNGFGNGGDLDITAYDSAEILGKSPFAAFYPFSSIIQTLSAGLGNSGKIVITAGQLSIQNGGELISTTFGNGTGGDITTNAHSIILNGFNSTNFIPSVIASTTLNVARSGNVFVNANQLTVKNGGEVNTSTLASGSAGNIIVNATDFVDISGAASIPIYPSSIISSAQLVDKNNQTILGIPQIPMGASGSTIINTGKLSISDGAQITARNDGFGNAGTLTINANSINLDKQGGITASTNSGVGGDINLHTAKQLNLDHNSIISATAGGQGNGGNITIDPQTTTISNGSGIAVNATGTGRAGQLKISSNNLTLNNGGFLSANTNGGEGGNIFLNAQNLQLRHSSLFTAAAQGSGNGGNISITTGTLAVLENSNITANATQRQGGNIRINAQGIFRSPDSNITASGGTPEQNGTVQVNTLVNNSSLAIVPLPIVPVDAAKLIAQGCGVNTGPRGNKFVVTGSGGLPIGPNEPQTGNTVWTDLGSDAAPKSVSSDSSDIENATPSTEYEYKGGPLVEAQGWVTNSKGEVVLTANPPTLTPDIPWVKPASCHAR